MSHELRLAAYRAVALEWKAPTITSHAISEALGINATQVRRDLSELGRHGKQGIGYKPAELAELVGEHLGPQWDAIRAEAKEMREISSRVLYSPKP